MFSERALGSTKLLDDHYYSAIGGSSSFFCKCTSTVLIHIGTDRQTGWCMLSDTQQARCIRICIFPDLHRISGLTYPMDQSMGTFIRSFSITGKISTHFMGVFRNKDAAKICQYG